MMDLSDLRIFRAVVEEGGITRAAERLHRVQSNVTTRIRQLEDDLGVDLFTRHGKRLHLAPAGHILVDYADKLLALADEARDAVQDSHPRGTLRIGSMESTAAVRLPSVLAEYGLKYPDVTLELRTGTPGQMAAAILAGEVDAAFVAEPIADTPFDKLTVFVEPLVIISAKNAAAFGPDSQAPNSVIVFENGCPHRVRLDQWYASRGEMPGRTIELSSYHAMIGCVAAGMGIALLPKSVLETFPECKRLQIHELPEGQDTAETVLIWRKGVESPKTRALTDIFEP